MKTKRKNRKGFSLVELIVVLLIIAVLSAALVPSLIGYIKHGRNAAYMQEAKLCVTGVQSSLAESCAFTPPSSDAKQIFSGPVYNDTNSDVVCSFSVAGKAFEGQAEALFERKPYMLIVGLGDYCTYKDTDYEKVYRPYVIIYWPDKNTYPLFYNGSTWTEKYPWTENVIDRNNNLNLQGEKIKLQFYFVTYPSSYGDNLRGIVDKCWADVKNAAGVK